MLLLASEEISHSQDSFSFSGRVPVVSMLVLSHFEIRGVQNNWKNLQFRVEEFACYDTGICHYAFI